MTHVLVVVIQGFDQALVQLGFRHVIVGFLLARDEWRHFIGENNAVHLDTSYDDPLIGRILFAVRKGTNWVLQYPLPSPPPPNPELTKRFIAETTKQGLISRTLCTRSKLAA